MGLLDTIKKSSIFNSKKASNLKKLFEVNKKQTKKLLSDTAKTVGTHLTAFRNTVESPMQILKESSKNLKKGGDYLVKSGDKIVKNNKTKNTSVNLVGNTIKSTGEFIGGIEDTRKNIVDIGKKVKSRKITITDGIIEAGTSAGLQGISTIAAPFVVGANTALKTAGVDKYIDNASKFTTDLLTNYAEKELGFSPEKAKSRVNSFMNIVQGGTMLKGMRTLNKGGSLSKLTKNKKVKTILNTVQAGTEMGAVPIAETIVYGVANLNKDAGKDMPKPGDFSKALTMNIATSVAGLKAGKGIKSPKVSKPKLSETAKVKTVKAPKNIALKETKATKASKILEEKIANPKLSTTTKVSKPKLSTVAKVKTPRAKIENGEWTNVKSAGLSNIIKKAGPNKIKIEDYHTPNDIKKINSFNKGVDKRAKNTVVMANELAKQKKEGTIKKTNKTMNLKKDILEEGKKYNTMKDGAVDKGRKTVKITDKGYKLAKGEKDLGKGYHTDKVTDKKTNKKTNKVTDKELEQFSFSDKIKDKPTTKPKTNILNLKGTVNGIKEVLNGKDIHLDFITDKTQKLSKTAEKVGSVLSENLGNILKNIKIVDKKGNARDFQDINDGLRGDNRGEFKNQLFNAFNIKDIQNLEKNNTNAINKGYDYVMNNLDTLGDSIPAKFIKSGIKSIDDGIFHQNTSIKTINSTKNRALMNYVTNKTKLLIEDLKKQRKISEDGDIPLRTKKQIFNSVVKELPPETQKYVLEFNKKYNVIKGIGKGDIFKILENIGQELKDAGILKETKEGYMHGLILKDIFKTYKSLSKAEKARLKKELGPKTLEELQSFVKGEKELSPEQVSTILKKSKNVWYLHSGNPLDIITSYVNEMTKLKEQKDTLEAIKILHSKNKEVGAYLEEKLGNEGNFLYNKLLGLHPKKGLAKKSLEKVSFGTSAANYIGNVSMPVQNLAFGLLQTLGLGMKLGAKGNLKYSLKNDTGDIRKYLVDHGIVSHKSFNVDGTLKGNAKLSDKIKINSKNSVSKAMRFFTATVIPQMQSFLATGMMQKAIKKYGGGLKKGENIVEGYERTLKSLPKDKSLLLRADLAKEIKRIEDGSYTNTATSKWLDLELLKMVKAFSRQTMGHITGDVKDTIDILNKGNKSKAKKEFSVDNGGTKGRLADNAIDFTTKTVALMYTAKAIASLFSTEEEKKDAEEYIFAKSMEDYLLYLVGTPLGAPGVSMVGQLILKAGKNLDKIGNADNFEDRKKYTEQLIKDLAPGLTKLYNSLENIRADYGDGKHIRHTSAGGGYAYTDTKPTNALGYILNVNPGKSGYSQYYQMEKDLKKDIPRDIGQRLDDFINSSRQLRLLFGLGKGLMNAKQQAQVGNVINRIKKLENKKITSDEWLDKVIGTENNIKLSDNTKIGFNAVKDKKRIDNQLEKLKYMLDDLVSKNEVVIDKKDFNKSLKELRVSNPKLYNDFMNRVLNTAITDDGKGNKSTKLFIQNLINRDLDGALLGTTIGNRVMQLNRQLAKVNNPGEVITDKKNLIQLNSTLELLNTLPELKKQIFDSLADKAKIPSNKNLGDYILAVKEYPEIEKLYKRAAELRGGIFKKTKQEEPKIDKQDKKDYNISNTEDYTPKGKSKGIKLSDIIPTKKIKLDKVINQSQIKKPEVRLSKLSEMIKK